jgi:hypothetical protein
MKKITMLVFLALACAFLALPSSSPGSPERYPGVSGDGPFGWTCYCPPVYYADCECILVFQGPGSQ